MSIIAHLQSFGSCFDGVDLSKGLYLSMFVAGLVGSVSHCVAMCGPFVMARSGGLEKISSRLKVPYHLGRLTTYVGLSVFVASLMNIAFLFAPIRSYIIAPILFTAGVIFLVNAFPRLGQMIPIAFKAPLFLPSSLIGKAMTKMTSPKEEKAGTLISFIKSYSLGILLGFMPCGLVVAAIMASITAPTIFETAMAMALFGLGTIPALVAVSFGGNMISKNFPKTFSYVRRGMLLWSCMWLFAIAGAVLIG